MTRQTDTKYYLRALKNILKKGNDSQSAFSDIALKLGINFGVMGCDEKLLFGSFNEEFQSFNLSLGDIIYGRLLASNEDGRLLANMVMVLVKKELEKKKIGNEVLGLYREINMIYSFSEMISEKIDEKSIAEMALREASQIINSTHGLFLIYEPKQNKVVELAAFGLNPEKEKNIDKLNDLLKKLINKGTSAIVPSDKIMDNPALDHLKTIMYAPLKVKHRTLGMVILGHNNEKEFTAAELKLLTTISLQTAGALETAHLYQKGLQEAKEREEAIRSIHEVSQKFVPNEFIKSLGKDRLTEVSLGDLVEKEVTVVFADIREFTTISENLNPEDNFLFINSFNKRMGPIVRKNGGFIMQYLGDGFMALFPDGSQTALRASVEMHSELKVFNEERAVKDRFPVKLGIGMQNGNLIMGITGDIERLDAAIISDTVNTASRIEGLSKHYGSSILLTDNCKNNLTHPEEFDFRYLGPVQVKGKQKPIDLYECINGDSEQLLKHKLATLNTFEEGMKQYFMKEFAMAAVTFQQIVKKERNDSAAKLFLNRSAHMITQETGDDWKGIASISSK
ncbi:adenylate/guanylate cyclase domain-containing protein [uncultured Eudoraea sp.]|uniref:adenylate/guanylate cyclase domain-containing protein n=1 Tax=uncultured Eudoraea sp. TaxID=1035614 RepID=UPI002616DA67|nr:adenylate/guanylate cyclase domain-containing protein [uncultured Eudoraea sp.]